MSERKGHWLITHVLKSVKERCVESLMEPDVYSS